jgi:hypothetical protein
VVQDCLCLSEEQTAWGYRYDKGDGTLATHTLDLHVRASDISDQIRSGIFLNWVRAAAESIGVPPDKARLLGGAAFEIRQGYKSADSKRQNADLRFGLRAYADASLLPVIAIVSTQASDAVCRRYSDARLLVLRGTLDGDNSTFAFFRDIVGYDLADFFRRNAETIRSEFGKIVSQLLSASESN